MSNGSTSVEAISGALAQRHLPRRLWTAGCQTSQPAEPR